MISKTISEMNSEMISEREFNKFFSLHFKIRSFSVNYKLHIRWSQLYLLTVLEFFMAI